MLFFGFARENFESDRRSFFGRCAKGCVCEELKNIWMVALVTCVKEIPDLRFLSYLSSPQSTFVEVSQVLGDLPLRKKIKLAFARLEQF